MLTREVCFISKDGLQVAFYLKGEKGVVQFTFLLFGNGGFSKPLHVMPMDLCYHAYAPQYEGQSKLPCRLLEGGKCYYDGSSSNAIRVYELLWNEGSNAVWKELERYYHDLFTV